ncbi:hypothetical protein [Kribbella sp. CA-293567]|uniref:hypothetical protein n=1 Tax=Kribbella sp. CA-293567 TaxID=3002436 RepID=UPI0022DE93C9|nr:hypothetical protein [Kribbella sp. CA-293567]WBQ08386.1 hypothetical protein OX958_16595 [Kribbella sp. CA-293567]
MSRGRVIMLPAVTVAILLPACVLAWWDPFNLRYAGFFAAATTGLTAVAAAIVAVLIWRRRAVTIAAVVLGVLGVVFAGGTAWASAELSPRGPDRDRVVSSDGRYELVRVWGVAGSEVRLRRDRGLLSQETVVWYDDGSSPDGRDSGTVVPEFRFVDARSFEVTSGGCSHRSAFDPTTLLPKADVRRFPAGSC